MRDVSRTFDKLVSSEGYIQRVFASNTRSHDGKFTFDEGNFRMSESYAPVPNGRRFNSQPKAQELHFWPLVLVES